MEIKKSTADVALVFYMVDSTDHVTGKTGLSPTVVLSKNGNAFAAPIGAVTAIDHGFYKVAANAADCGTLGVLALRATATGADPVAMAYKVVDNIESDTITAIVGLDDHLLMIEENLAVVIGESVRAELAVELARLDVAVSTRLATAGYTAPNNPADATIAAAVRAAILTELGRIDDTITAIAGLDDHLLMIEEGLAGVIGEAVRTELAVELARLDVAVSSRLATAGYTAPNNPADATIAAAVRAAILTELGRLDVAVSSRLATAGYTAPNNPADATIAAAVRAAILTELGRLDVAVSSRLATAGYTAPNNPTNAAIGDAVRAKLEPEISRLAACATVESTGAQIAAFETA